MHMKTMKNSFSLSLTCFFSAISAHDKAWLVPLCGINILSEICGSIQLKEYIIVLLFIHLYTYNEKLENKTFL